LLAQGRIDEALATVADEPAEWARLWLTVIIHHARGDAQKSDGAMGILIEKYGRDAAMQIAEAHGARGEIEKAFEWLDVAYEERDPGLSEAKGSPELRALHGDPRWREFLKRMRLDD